MTDSKIRKNTKYIAIHCSATRPSLDVGVKEIRQWHKSQGWSDIGYHFVIRRDGRVEKGRPVDEIGAHVAGFNATSVGVCMVGGVDQRDYTRAVNNFTPAQFESLKGLLTQLVSKYPSAVVLGHRDFPNVNKACPSFDAKHWAKKNGFPI
jgi:N-acetylmuramoyl-L-alanine amidase